MKPSTHRRILLSQLPRNISFLSRICQILVSEVPTSWSESKISLVSSKPTQSKQPANSYVVIDDVIVQNIFIIMWIMWPSNWAGQCLIMCVKCCQWGIFLSKHLAQRISLSTALNFTYTALIIQILHWRTLREDIVFVITDEWIHRNCRDTTWRCRKMSLEGDRNDLCIVCCQHRKEP